MGKVRRVLSFALAALLAASVLICGFNASAIDQYDVDYTSSDGLWKYVRLLDGSIGIYANTWEENAYLGDETELTVPSEIDGNTVTQIGPFAFANNDKIKSVTLPDSITNISFNAFYRCSSLESVRFSEKLVSISDNAFKECRSLKEISLPDSVESISSCAFYGCSSLESFTAPKSVKSLSDSLFENCVSLKSVVLYAECLEYGSFFFDNCPSLESVTLYYNPKADYHHICEYVTKLIVPDGVREIGSNGVQNMPRLSSLTIGGKVEKIADEALKNSPELKEISGYSGSYAESFSEKNGYGFVSMGSLFEPFVDVVSDAWYFEAVNYNVRNGFINGYSASRFGPSDYMQRQDFVCIIARMSGAELDGYSSYGTDFPDVRRGSYYYNALMWAVDNKLIFGYQNGSFGVGDRITREQICAILYRYAAYMKKDTKVKGSPEYVLREYTDLSRVSSFSLFPTAWCVQNGIVSGKGKYRLCPTDYASRAEVAQMTANLGRNSFTD